MNFVQQVVFPLLGGAAQAWHWLSPSEGLQTSPPALSTAITYGRVGVWIDGL